MKGKSKMSKKKNIPPETEKEKEAAPAAETPAEPAEETVSEEETKDPAQQAWYYRSGAALLAELKDYEAWQEYSALVDAVLAELP